MSTLLSFEILVFLGLAALFWFLVWRPLAHEKARRKSPFTRDLVRAPGEGCLTKATELSDQLDSDLLLALLGPAILVGYVLGAQQSREMAPHSMQILIAVLLVMALSLSAFGMLKARVTIRERGRYRLGFLGERHTAQALTPLAADGYNIYHDLQCRKPGTTDTFNIDHALLGPAGVIAIETKTRSKPADAKGRPEVTFDGATLDFGTSRDAHGIAQALANARTLASLLAKRTGTKIPVVPILCLPGWWVNARTHEPLFVGNSEQVPARVRALPPVALDARTRNQIAALLEELSAAKVD